MAGELERHWNEALQGVRRIEGELAVLVARKPALLSEQERQHFASATRRQSPGGLVASGRDGCDTQEDIARGRSTPLTADGQVHFTRGDQVVGTIEAPRKKNRCAKRSEIRVSTPL